MRQRVKATVLGVLVLFAYFWTGAVAKLWLMRAEPGGAGMVGDLHRRAFRGSSPIGLNSEFRTLMSVYGPMPLGPLLGPGSASFLRGLGVGLDPNSTRYDARRREALERNLRLRILNPWRDQACLELAAMDAIPGAPSPGFARRPAKLAGAPAWITVGLVDPERWWVVRQPAGPDPAQAEALCAQALAGHPQDAVAAQALYLRASLAADRWDFRAEAEDWRELVLEHPASPLAEAALGYLAQGPTGGAEELIPLYQHALRHRPPEERTGLALTLALLQTRNGEVEAARATLRQALRALEPAARVHPEQAANRRHPLEQTLRSLEGRHDFVPPPSPAGEPGFPVRTRLLAAGKPLAGIAVALVPLAEAFQELPYPAGLEAGAPRPAGVYPPPRPPSFSPMQTGGRSWNMEAVAAAVRRTPSLVAHSDTAGTVRWPSVPAGAYALFVRLASWQIPDGGRRLSPVPTRAPVWVSAGAATLPAVRFIPPPRLTTGRTAAGIPSLRWQAVPGAARYRVALRDVTGATLMAAFEGEAGGSGAPEIDPAVIWWRDGVTGTGLQLTPAQFVGPAADRDRRGLLPGRWYSWYVEARANNGAVLATSESVGPPAILGGPFWLALRPPQPRPQERRRRLPLLSTAAGPPPGAAGPPPGANEFTSPFLQVLIRAPEGETVRLVERPRLPQVATNGQGLPPRGPIRIASPPPGPAPGIPASGGPASLPPALLARLQGLRRAPGLAPLLALGAPGRMPAFSGELPPQLLAQLQRARPGAPPAGLPPQLLAQLAAARTRPGRPLPLTGNGPKFGSAGLSPAALASVLHRQAGDGRPNTVGSGAKPPRATDSLPREMLSVAALVPTVIELERFGPGCMERWRAVGENAPGEPAAGGLPIRQPLTLIPSGPPLELPPGSRRILARLAGAPADLTVTLSSSHGEQRQLSLRAEAGQQSVLSASVPAGTWSVAALTLAPPAAGDTRLLALTAEVAPTPGLFGTARQQGNLLELRLYNLGPAAEHAAVQGRAAAPLVETDLGPEGQALLRLPLAAMGEPPLPPALTLRWQDHTRAIPVR